MQRKAESVEQFEIRSKFTTDPGTSLVKEQVNNKLLISILWVPLFCL